MIRNDLWEHVVEPVLHAEYKELFTEQALLPNFLVNPTGQVRDRWPGGRRRPDRPQDHRRHLRWRGSPRRRRLLGQGPLEVDRSAAYAARYVAKNVVAAGLADRCEIQVAYAIGVAHPVSLMAQTFGTGKVSDTEIVTRSTRSSTSGPAPSGVPRPSPADLPEDRRLRPLRPRATHDFTWERDRPRGRAALGSGPPRSDTEAARRSVSLDARRRTRPAGPGPALVAVGWSPRPVGDWRGSPGRPAGRRRRGSRRRRR